MFSSFTESQVIAFFLTSFVLLLLYAIGFIVETVPGAVGDAISFVSFQTRFLPFARGLIDTRDVVYFLSIAVICLLVSLPRARAPEVGVRGNPMAMERKTKAATESAVLLVIIAVICVVANVLARWAFAARKDVTKTERYTLSQGSGRLVESMKQQMTVDAYVTKGLAQARRLHARPRGSAQGVRGAGGGKFKYTLIEAKTDEQRRSRPRTRASRPCPSARPAKAKRRRASPRATWASSSSTAARRT